MPKKRHQLPGRLRRCASCAPFGTVARIYTAIMSCTTIRDVRLFFQTRREKILRMRFILYCVSRKKASNLLMLRRNKPLKKCAERKWDEHYFANGFLYFYTFTVWYFCMKQLYWLETSFCFICQCKTSIVGTSSAALLFYKLIQNKVSS